MTTICTICARGGSKGLPGKNKRILLGKPLIAYTINQAMHSELFDKIYVSTDSPEIAEIAKEYGAIVPFMRPAELANDEASKIAVIQHLVEFLEKDGIDIRNIVDLDPTSPLRDIDDICNAFNLIHDADVVITGYLSNKNPYFNMVEKKCDNFFKLSKESNNIFAGRQSAPPVYAMNASIYVWHRDSLSRGIWDNQKIAFYEMPVERSVDIDTTLDWKLVELLMQERMGR
jgi:CMP-N,N'-diacetyllegionaminic acid synthase